MATDYFGKLLVNCGGETYAIEAHQKFVSLFQKTSRERNDLEIAHIFQFRGIAIGASPRNLSAADRMNGIEYSGSITMSARFTRVFNLATKEWGDWREGEPLSAFTRESVSLTKRNGQWQLGYVGSLVRDFVPNISCDDINRALAREKTFARATPKDLIPILKLLENDIRDQIFGYISQPDKSLVTILHADPLSGLPVGFLSHTLVSGQKQLSQNSSA